MQLCGHLGVRSGEFDVPPRRARYRKVKNVLECSAMNKILRSCAALAVLCSCAAWEVDQRVSAQSVKQSEESPQKGILIRKLPVSKDFTRALLNQSGHAGILASVFVQAVGGCFGDRWQSSAAPDVPPSKELVESAYQLARADTTPLQNLSTKLIAIGVPELPGQLEENPCIIAAAFSRTELANGSRAQLMKIPADQWNNREESGKLMPKYIEFLESTQSAMIKLMNYINDNSNEISTLPLLGIFFGEEHLPFKVASQETSKTSCILTMRLDMHKIPYLKTLVIGAHLTTTTADLADRKPEGVTDSKVNYGELGTHYRITVVHGDRECTNSCTFSWELSDDAISTPGVREFEVHVRNIGPPLNGSNPGSFKITPFYEQAFALQSSQTTETPIEGCN